MPKPAPKAAAKKTAGARSKKPAPKAAAKKTAGARSKKPARSRLIDISAMVALCERNVVASERQASAQEQMAAALSAMAERGAAVEAPTAG